MNELNIFTMENHNSTSESRKKMTLLEEIESWRQQGYKSGEMKAQAERNLKKRNESPEE